MDWREEIDKRTMALHDTQKLDDDFWRRAYKDLALATALGIDNVVLQGEFDKVSFQVFV